MNQKPELSFIENLIIIVVLGIIFAGSFGGLRYQFFPRTTLDSAMVDFCKERGLEFMLMKIGDSAECSFNGEEKECFVWSCIKNKK